MAAGGVSLLLTSPSSSTVRVAGISIRPMPALPADATLRELAGREFEGIATPAELEAIRQSDTVTNDDLLARAEREMQAGARIVVWGEGNARMILPDEPAYVARAQALAAKYDSYLAMGLLVGHIGKPISFENKLVLIQPDGRIAWEVAKARPVPGGEAARQIRGDGRLRSLASPYGRLSSVICYDGDFPNLLAQAGASRTDILLDPSNDWPAIDPWHTQMASFRAIEQGFNLVRPTSRGLSASFDYQGRVLAATDYFHTTDYAMVAQIPTRGRTTLFRMFGDWFAYACMAGLVLLVLVAMVRTSGQPAGPGQVWEPVVSRNGVDADQAASR
jgi:apolipoprotein N-acyltransferase